MVEQPKEYPKTFTDSKGRSWSMLIGWGTFQRVKQRCGLDLNSLVPVKGMKPADHDAIVQRYHDLIYSTVEFPSVVMVILESQMKAAGVTEDEFMDGFETPESVDSLIGAFRQALIDFIPDPLRKAILRKVLQGIDRMQMIAEQELETRTEAMLTQGEADFRAKIESTLKKPSTDSAESSADMTPTNQSLKA
jgi:hypothetical protein